MKLAKDLTYTTGNGGLDIARVSSVLAVLTFLGLSINYYGVEGAAFDPIQFGGGVAALFAGCAGWIYARQKWEVELKKAEHAPAPASPYGFNYAMPSPTTDIDGTRLD